MVGSRNRQPINLIDQLEHFLLPRVTGDGALTIALSGGCDSVVLLHGLSKSRFAPRLAAFHVNHGLSENAETWAAFCARYCDSLGVPFQQRSVVVERAGSGLEAAARAARYGAFRDAGVQFLLTGHHRGDLAETVLFNLLRGTGVVGAAGMAAERKMGAMWLLRPMLAFSRTEIESYAKQNGLSWVTDESNCDTAFSRNYLRHDIMGVIKARFPAAECALAQAAANFGEASGLLDELAAQDWEMVADGDAASLSRLKRLSPDRMKNVLRYRLRELGWQVPVASRLNEFVRQLADAAPDRHPELSLVDGTMRVARGRLHWLAQI